MNVPRALLLALLAAGLCACTPSSAGHPSPAAGAAPPVFGPAPVEPTPAGATSAMQGIAIGEPAPDAGRAYTIDRDASRLRLRVYRGGPLARLGHNHVILAPLAGSARIAGDLLIVLDAGTRPADWRVDDADERARAGAGFESVPDADAIEGTGRNLRSAAVLDAEHYPEVLLHAVQARREGDELPLQVRVNVRDHVSQVPVRLHIAPTGEGWRGIGSATLSQAALGLAPFAALGGALVVEDRIDVEIDVTLRAERAP